MRGAPGLRMDAVTITRDSSTADAEGNYVRNAITVFSGRGTFTEDKPEFSTDSAGRPFSIRKGVLEIRPTAPVLDGDRGQLRGSAWGVVAVGATRTHTVVHLVSPPPGPFA